MQKLEQWDRKHYRVHLSCSSRSVSKAKIKYLCSPRLCQFCRSSGCKLIDLGLSALIKYILTPSAKLNAIFARRFSSPEPFLRSKRSLFEKKNKTRRGIKSPLNATNYFRQVSERSYRCHCKYLLVVRQLLNDLNSHEFSFDFFV